MSHHLLGGTIVQQIGYEALFVVALAMVLGALFVTLRYIHSPRTEDAAISALHARRPPGVTLSLRLDTTQ